MPRPARQPAVPGFLIDSDAALLRILAGLGDKANRKALYLATGTTSKHVMAAAIRRLYNAGWIDTTGVGRHEKITVLDEVPIDDPVPIRKAPGVFRNCLSCRQEFRSAGPGNRVCERCKDGDAWKTRATIYSIGHYRKG